MFKVATWFKVTVSYSKSKSLTIINQEILQFILLVLAFQSIYLKLTYRCKKCEVDQYCWKVRWPSSKLSSSLSFWWILGFTIVSRSSIYFCPLKLLSIKFHLLLKVYILRGCWVSHCTILLSSLPLWIYLLMSFQSKFVGCIATMFAYIQLIFDTIFFCRLSWVGCIFHFAWYIQST